jgi:hypothetical protein
MTTNRGLILLGGYLVRFPLGGFAWQAAHYLLGLQRLGYEVWFYEDTGYFAPAFDPTENSFTTDYGYGLAAVDRFLESLGLGERWIFLDAQRRQASGPGAGRLEALFREADLVINLGLMNRCTMEKRRGRPAIYVDLDPAYTQIRLSNGDAYLRAVLEGHSQIFTFGENIGTSRSPIPTGGYDWQATRQPVALELWAGADGPGRAYTTVGQWTSQGRDLTYHGRTFHWDKRREWLRFLDLPGRTKATLEMAMNVESVAGDAELLSARGWRVVDPQEVSLNPWRYRDYLRSSRGEFTVAKEMNICLRSGWFSDRAACYLAAGRPVVEQDTGFADILPLGPGLHAFETLEEAALALERIDADYDRASRHAYEVAQEYFAAEKVLSRLLAKVGF